MKTTKLTESLAATYSELGISHKVTGKLLEVESSEQAVGKLWLKGVPPLCGSEAPFTSDAEFYGESIADWHNAVSGEKVNMAVFNKAQEKNKVFAEKIQEKLSQYKPMRKRRFSENDGEFLLDRQYEITPFASTYNTSEGVGRTITINADMSISCANTTEEIARYGAFVYGIIKSLEDNGVTCEVVLWNSGEISGQRVFEKMVFKTKVKSFGEYISEQRLARSFCTAQLRRNVFSLIVNSCSLYGERAESDLGRPYPLDKKKISGPGELNLTPNDPQKLSQETVMKAVLDALGI